MLVRDIDSSGRWAVNLDGRGGGPRREFLGEGDIAFDISHLFTASQSVDIPCTEQLQAHRLTATPWTTLGGVGTILPRWQHHLARD